MTLLTRDMEDIVAATIEHALSLGVDLIVATDNGSVDSTPDILADYQRAGVLELHHEPTHNYAQGRWVTGMARRAATVHRAAWIINSDADEFLWPTEGAPAGSLHRELARIPFSCGLIGLSETQLRRDPSLSGPWIDSLLLARQGGSVPGFSFWKVAHRADSAVRVMEGNHHAYGPLIGPMAASRPFFVFHLPERSYEQYARKVSLAGPAYAANPRLHPTVGAYLREHFELLKRGQLERFYAERQARFAAELSGRPAETRLRDHLRSLMDSAVLPARLQQALDFTYSDASTSRAR